MSHDRGAHCRRAFTLVELLMVIAILALLAALLFPVLAQVRESGRQTACRSNLRQIGLALDLYRQDYNAFPPHLSTLYPAYVRDARIYVCPSDPDRGLHDGNDFLEGNLYLPSGVSYDYLPNWSPAWEAGWWKPPPHPGPGKWEDLTPISECAWHWARVFYKETHGNVVGSRGWMFVLTAGGSVRRRRVEEPLPSFTPERYR
jgi:prepilin-type N-terminal cleavage/methylation domain-containing protein